MNAEIREQLLQGDTEIEYETFTATPSEDADRSNPDGWNIAYEDHQLGEVFWNDNGYIVFHADADYIHANVLQDIADFMDTVEAVAEEQENVTTNRTTMKEIDEGVEICWADGSIVWVGRDEEGKDLWQLTNYTTPEQQKASEIERRRRYRIS